MSEDVAPTLADVGEKDLIRKLIRPLFNPDGLPWGVGDDCALASLPPGRSLLASTDRVPADLVSFKAGVIDHKGLGSYLVRLNLSDIAACGGTPLGLLLNLGLPRSLPVHCFKDLIEGVQEEAARHECSVLGGDLSDGAELSISATALGHVDPALALSRRDAKPGDSVFISRAPGLTPAAFRYLANKPAFEDAIPTNEVELLLRQFTHISPMIALGQLLLACGECSTCMDNTDGLSQTLSEIAEAAGVAITVYADLLDLPPVVLLVARTLGLDPIDLALSAGADFSLVGTLRGQWSTEQARAKIGREIRIIGYTETGGGLFLHAQGRTMSMRPVGWNYYA